MSYLSESCSLNRTSVVAVELVIKVKVEDAVVNENVARVDVLHENRSLQSSNLMESRLGSIYFATVLASLINLNISLFI